MTKQNKVLEASRNVLIEQRDKLRKANKALRQKVKYLERRVSEAYEFKQRTM